jgi:hypothetical protein
MCKDEMRDPDILWVRSFALSGSQVNAIALIENRNPTAILKNIDYTFYIYDEKNILIATRTGATVVAPNSQFYIFEHGIDTGNKLPARTLLVFGEIKNPWVKFPFARTRDLDMRISDQKSIYGDTPRVRAILENKSLLPLRNISVRAIVFDAKGNAIGASTTKISTLKEKSQAPLIFTWPRAFTSDAVRTEIVPFINPFEQEYE